MFICRQIYLHRVLEKAGPSSECSTLGHQKNVIMSFKKELVMASVVNFFVARKMAYFVMVHIQTMTWTLPFEDGAHHNSLPVPSQMV